MEIKGIFMQLLLTLLAAHSIKGEWCTQVGIRTYNEVYATNSEPKNITRLERICCEGYALKGAECKPICQNDCPYGECIEPGNCKCHQNYQLDPATQICNPVCSNKCGFGKCIKPETCDCDPGYVFNDSSKTCEYTCDPKCPVNSKCVGPNQCDCYNGYEAKGNNTDAQIRCEPACNSPGCVNGICTAPNICECFKGHTRNVSSPICWENICKPSCPSTAYCEANGVCVCHDGYSQSKLTLTKVSSIYCEYTYIYALKLLGILLILIVILAIIVILIAKLCIKEKSYKPFEEEDKIQKMHTKKA